MVERESQIKLLNVVRIGGIPYFGIDRYLFWIELVRQKVVEADAAPSISNDPSTGDGLALAEFPL